MLVHANIELCEENSDGVAVTLYFESHPEHNHVQDALNKHTRLCASGESESFTFSEYPNELSRRAGLVRIQVYPN